MNCKDFKEKSYEFAVGELSAEECRIMAEHMEKCEECKAEYDGCVRLIRELKSLGEAEAPKDLLSNVMDEISRIEKKPKLLSRLNSAAKFGTAVAAAVILLAGTVMLSPVIKHDIQMKNMEEIGRDLENAQNDEIMPELASAGEIIEGEPEQEKAKIESNPFANDDKMAAAENKSEGNINSAKINDVNDSEEKSAVKTEKADIKNEAAQNQETLAKETFGGAVSNTMPTQGGGVSRSAFSQNDSLTSGIEENDNGISPQNDILESVQKDLNGEIAVYSLNDEAATSKSGGGSGRRYIQMITEFVVSEEYGEAALAISTENKTSEQVANELGDLEIPFEVNIKDKDYTEEYAFADENRKAEIEKLCEKEICTIITKEVEENEDRSTEQGF